VGSLVNKFLLTAVPQPYKMRSYFCKMLINAFMLGNSIFVDQPRPSKDNHDLSISLFVRSE